MKNEQADRVAILSILIVSICTVLNVNAYLETDQPASFLRITIDLLETKSISDLVELIKNIVYIFAIIVGAIWTYVLFYKNREKDPKANISLNIEHLEVNENQNLIRTNIIIENIGKVLIPVVSMDVRLMQILPQNDKTKKAIDKFYSQANISRQEIDWPELQGEQRHLNAEVCEIEPGEKEFYFFDFIIDNKIKVVEIYVYIQNIRKKKMGWRVNKIYKIY